MKLELDSYIRMVVRDQNKKEIHRQEITFVSHEYLGEMLEHALTARVPETGSEAKTVTVTVLRHGPYRKRI